MARKSIFEKRRGGQFIYEDEDLMRVQVLEHDAESVMHRLEHRVSKSLLFMLNQQLLGFSSQMQQELAMDMVDYVCDDVMRMTGCPSADYVLEICYAWINEEVCDSARAESSLLETLPSVSKLDVKHQIGGIA